MACGSQAPAGPYSSPAGVASTLITSGRPGASPAPGRTPAPERTASASDGVPTGGQLATLGPGGTPFPLATVVLTQPPATPMAPPGSQVLGVPEWVRPGTRVTFYQAAASVAQSRFAFVEDPAGEWVVASTGKHYRRTDESGEGVPTASGDGLTQVDVMAVEGNDVVGTITLYGIDRGTNQFVVVPATGGKVNGALVDGVWIHPKLLGQLAATDLGGLLVLRGPYAIAGTTYDAVSFANPTPGAYQSYTYDTVSGLLLAATTSTAGPTSPVAAANEPPPQGNTQLTITRFAGVRQRSVPGLNGTNPAWVARTSRLDYAGTYNFTNPVDPSSANLTYPMSLSVTLGPGGPNWSSYQAQTFIQLPGGQPTQSAGVTGTAGLYWIDPRALAGLSAGQVLDRDPITGEVNSVASVGPGVAGPAVSFGTQLPGVQGQTTYDATSGVLLEYVAFQASNGTTVRLQLQRMP